MKQEIENIRKGLEDMGATDISIGPDPQNPGQLLVSYKVAIHPGVFGNVPVNTERYPRGWHPDDEKRG